MKLMVLDGNSIVNRAYYGVGKARLLTTRQGLHTNAIYGFVTMLQKLINRRRVKNSRLDHRREFFPRINHSSHVHTDG